MQSKVKRTVTILGAGSFGTSLAVHLARQNCLVNLWSFDPSVADAINSQHRNPCYLDHIDLSENIRAFSYKDRIAEFTATEMVVFATPTQVLREVLRNFKDALLASPSLLVSVVKGIEVGTLCFPSQIIQEELGAARTSSLAVLSGPSFAVEIAESQPTGIAAASLDSATAKKVQEFFHSPLFRVYTNNDPIGLEVAGGLKNVISIAAGVCTGLGFQNNSMASLITRGLAEITRIGVKLGANPLTFNGLGGVGDLLLSCTSQKSRNFSVGYRLGKGESLQNILNSLNAVAEGVATTHSAYDLCSKLGVRAPIISLVYQVLYEKKPLNAAIYELTNGDAKSELEFSSLDFSQRTTS